MRTMDVKVNAVVLKAAAFNESDKLLTLLSPERGRFTALAKGVRKPAAKLKFAAEPFCFGEYLFAKGKGPLVLTGCSAFELFYDLRTDVERFYLASAAAELALIVTNEEENAAALTVFFLDFLKECAFGQAEKNVLAVHLLLGILRLAGYGVSFAECTFCGEQPKQAFFSFANGTVSCEKCKKMEDREIPAPVFTALRLIDSFPAEKLASLRLKEGDCRSAAGLLARYAESIFGVRLTALRAFFAL